MAERDDRKDKAEEAASQQHSGEFYQAMIFVIRSTKSPGQGAAILHDLTPAERDALTGQDRNLIRQTAQAMVGKKK